MGYRSVPSQGMPGTHGTRMPYKKIIIVEDPSHAPPLALRGAQSLP